MIGLRALATPTAALLALALAACGGSDGGSDTAATTGSTAGGAATTTSGAAASSGLASKPPADIIAETARALRKVRSYHLDGTATDKDGPGRLVGDVSGANRLRFSLRQKGSTASFILIGPDAYLRADRKFWENQAKGGSKNLAAVLAGRWVKVPASAAGSLRGFAPRDLAHCLTHNIGTLTNKGTRKLDGKDVVVIGDKGNHPGGAPGELYVAASGPTLPLRVRQTGASSKGGSQDARCGDDGSEDTTTKSDYRISNYDKPVTINAPPNALDPEDLQGGDLGDQQQS